MIDLLSALCTIDVLWAPSHCGLYQNELVDALAKEALDLPLAEQLTAPADYSNVKRRVTQRQYCSSTIISAPESLQSGASQRESEVALSQLPDGHLPCLHLLGSHL